MNKTRIINLSAILLAVLAFMPNMLIAQKVGYISSDEIRKHFFEAKDVETRIKSIVEDWKRQLNDYDFEIESLEFEIKKNRLIWSDEEKKEKENKLDDLKQKRLAFTKEKFATGGEYDKVVKEMKRPVEAKIFAAVQAIASDEGYDLILDKSLHPIPYANAKYDLTVKVLRKLGVDVKELEKQLQEKIAKDPRNKKSQAKDAPKRRSRRRRTQDREIKRDAEVKNIDENSKESITPPTPEEDEKKENTVTPPDGM